MKNIFLFAILLTTCALTGHSQNWLWGRSGDGIGSDGVSSVSADMEGNVFVTGQFHSQVLTFGTTILANAGGNRSDVFIAKYGANGNLLWATSAGGTGDDEGYSVSADTGGNVFVTGYFNSSSITFGSTVLTNSVLGYCLFVVKYDPDGNVVWARGAGGIAYNTSAMGRSVSADHDGNVFVTGNFSGYTVTFGSITLSSANTPDVFIVKYDINGNVLWAKSAGGIGMDLGYSVSSDTKGNVAVTGSFSNPTITFGSITLTNTVAYHESVFIVKYDANGNVLWAKCTAATKDAVAYSVTTDPDGNVFVTGRGSMLTFDSITLANVGMFVAKYDVNGNVLWAKRATGTGVSSSSGYAISADEDGSVFVAGYFTSSVITFDSITLFLPLGSKDAMFIVKYDANGGVLCASVLPCYGLGVSADRFGNAYIGGGFAVSPFIIGTDTLLATSATWYKSNIFVAKYSCNNSISVNELNNEESISVFPNPSSGIFTVDLSSCQAGAKVAVRDVLGNCVFEKNCQGGNSQQIDGSTTLTINLSGQPKGIYFVELQSGDERVVRKVAIQ